MDREFDIKCLYRGKLAKAKILLTFVANGETLLEYIDDKESIKFTEAHLFSSFCNLRKYLVTKDKILLCKGCWRNVYPRPLTWIYANILTKGVFVDPDSDKVMIFDEEVEPDKIVSVEEQYQFYLEWIESVK